jgi:hypothetical protein
MIDDVMVRRKVTGAIPTRRYVMQTVSQWYGDPIVDYPVSVFNDIWREVVGIYVSEKAISDDRIGLIARRRINGCAKPQKG